MSTLESALRHTRRLPCLLGAAIKKSLPPAMMSRAAACSRRGGLSLTWRKGMGHRCCSSALEDVLPRRSRRSVAGGGTETMAS